MIMLMGICFLIIPKLWCDNTLQQIYQNSIVITSDLRLNLAAY